MKLTWPNLLSALRLALVPIFIVSLIERRPGQALLIFALAGLTDLLDGFFARFLKQQSVLGAYLDPAADKLLLTAAFVMLAIPGLHPGQQIPIWVTVSVITRDVGIVVIALIVHLAIGITKFPPSVVSKWTTAFQTMAVAAVLLTGLDRRFDFLATSLVGVMVVLTVASALEYGYRFVYRADDLAAEHAKKSAETAADSPGQTPETEVE